MTDSGARGLRTLPATLLSLLPTLRNAPGVTAVDDDGGFLREIATSPALAEAFADLLIEDDTLWRRQLGSVFPDLHSIPDDGPNGLSVRCHNCLERARVRSWSALSELTMEQIFRIPNLGRRTLQELVTVIVRDWVQAHLGGTLGRAPHAAPVASESTHPRIDSDLDAAQRDRDVARFVARLQLALERLWETRGSLTVRDALAEMSRPEVASDIVATLTDILDLEISSLTGAAAPSENTWSSLLAFNDRTLTILGDRRYLATRATLEELGQRFHVTRERIRQVEQGALQSLTERWESDPACAPLRHLVALTEREVGSVNRPDVVHEAIRTAVLRSSDDVASIPLRSGVFSSLMEPRTTIAGLSLTESAETLLEHAARTIGALGPGAAIDTEWLYGMMDQMGAPSEVQGTLMQHLELREFHGRIVRWQGSLNEKAVIALTVHDQPMTMDQLHDAVGFDANPRSLTNAVQADSRIMRLGRELYGLRAWGGEEYSGILEELQQAIERSPSGRIQLSEIIPRFVEQFGVSEGSIRSYARDWRFVFTHDGALRFRTGSDPDPTIRHQRPDDTPGLFRVGDVWHLRVIVDEELLRGSGRPTRNSVASTAGLEPGLALGFDYEGGTVTFSWRSTQPSIGSLRGIALAHGCVEEDRLFIPLTGPEPRKSRVTRFSDIERAAFPLRLALEVGLTAQVDAAGKTAAPVARTLGLPLGADWHDVADRLRARGDQDLLGLMPSEWR